MVRDDLDPGLQMSQVVHSMMEFQSQFPLETLSWYQNSNYIAILSIKDENSLKDLIKKLTLKGIFHSVFREPDLSNSITALAISPGEKSKRLLSSLPLALKKYKSK